MQAKAFIRQRALEWRGALSADVRADFDRRITERAQTALPWRKYRRVMIFLPIERHHEIDTWQLVRWMWSEHPQIVVYAPRARGLELDPVQITPETRFMTSRWGIPEPADSAGLAPGEELDLVLTPLLSFDESGHRVGYGRGFYDRYFIVHPYPRRVGLGYEGLLVPDGIAAEAHDVPLQEVLTQTKRHRFRLKKQPR